jgi:hypothetical protein
MVNERSIKWGRHTPSSEDIKAVLDDFLALDFSVTWEKDRWIVKIQGDLQDPVLKKEDFIEIVPPPHHKALGQVLTKHPNPITDAFANGLAKYLAYRLEGKQIIFISDLD